MVVPDLSLPKGAWRVAGNGEGGKAEGCLHRRRAPRPATGVNPATCYHVIVTKRTTVEIDPELLEQAREVLGETTTRGTVEEALRRVTSKTSIKGSPSAVKQRHYLEQLSARADLSILASEQMWR